MHLKLATFERKNTLVWKALFFPDPFFSAAHFVVNAGATTLEQNASKVFLVKVHGSQLAFFKICFLSFFLIFKQPKKL